MSEWISVNDRMPDKNKSIIINIDFDSKHVGPLVICGKWTGNTFKVGPNGVKKEDEDGIIVTHWMPLPEPPEK